MARWITQAKWPNGQMVDPDPENAMHRAHLLWTLATLLTRLGNHAARAETRRRDHGWGGRNWWQ